MSDTETFGTLRGSVDDLVRMVNLASAGYHDDLYLRSDGSTVNALMQTGGRQVMSYTTFTEDYFAEVSGEFEAFIPVEKYVDFLDAAASDGTVAMRFDGTEGSGDHPRLASHWEAEGAMNVRIRLPGSQADLETIPWNLPKRFNERAEFVSQSCYNDDWTLKTEFEDPDDQRTPPTRVTINAETVADTIVAKADFVYDGDADYYPVVVEDGTLTFEMDVDGDDAVWGTIEADDVTGPDVNNVYKNGFAELVGTLADEPGPIVLATAPSEADAPDAPLVVTETAADYVTRHVIGSFSRT